VWPTYAISNHDQSRHATRWGTERVRAAAFLLLTLRGVAVLYAGEEIGLEDADEAILPDPPFDRAGRDGYRTPMQWDASPSGGFTDGTPWLPAIDPATRNVADQRDDPGSLLSLYRRLIASRRACAPLRRGDHRSIFGVGPGVIAWLRETDEERVLCLLNVGEARATCLLPPLGTDTGEVVVSTGTTREGRIALDGLALEPLEGLALQL
jgi:alpha-glucosidase